jgi:hypothetical protein
VNFRNGGFITEKLRIMEIISKTYAVLAASAEDAKSGKTAEKK